MSETIHHARDKIFLALDAIGDGDLPSAIRFLETAAANIRECWNASSDRRTGQRRKRLRIPAMRKTASERRHKP